MPQAQTRKSARSTHRFIPHAVCSRCRTATTFTLPTKPLRLHLLPTQPSAAAALSAAYVSSEAGHAPARGQRRRCCCLRNWRWCRWIRCWHQSHRLRPPHPSCGASSSPPNTFVAPGERLSGSASSFCRDARRLRQKTALRHVPSCARPWQTTDHPSCHRSSSAAGRAISVASHPAASLPASSDVQPERRRSFCPAGAAPSHPSRSRQPPRSRCRPPLGVSCRAHGARSTQTFQLSLRAGCHGCQRPPCQVRARWAACAASPHAAAPARS